MQAELDLDDPLEQLVDDRRPVVRERALERRQLGRRRLVDRGLRARGVGRVLAR